MRESPARGILLRRHTDRRDDGDARLSGDRTYPDIGGTRREDKSHHAGDRSLRIGWRHPLSVWFGADAQSSDGYGAGAGMFMAGASDPEDAGQKTTTDG